MHRIPPPQQSLLEIAWLIFAISLFTPAARYRPFKDFLLLGNLGWDPVGLILIVWLAELWHRHWSFHSPTALAVNLFLLITVSLLFARRDPLVARIRAIASFGLLAVWIFPIHFYSKPHSGTAAFEWTGLAWGYYLFASSLTLAFIALQLGSPYRRDPGRLRRPAFQVVQATPPNTPPAEAAEPQHSPADPAVNPRKGNENAC